jgi:hypothetical protein
MFVNTAVASESYMWDADLSLANIKMLRIMDEALDVNVETYS